MKSYTFKVVIEDDEFADGTPAYHVYVPTLRGKGGSTWGHTVEEALTNIQDVISLVIEDMIENGESIPLDAENDTQVSPEPLVTVTLSA